MRQEKRSRNFSGSFEHSINRFGFACFRCDFDFGCSGFYFGFAADFDFGSDSDFCFCFGFGFDCGFP